MPTNQELAHRFVYHAPHGTQTARYERIRRAILEAACFCVSLTPDSPEQAKALDALDQAMFLFNAAIARNEKETPK